jgi:hypothetical protein
MAGAMRASVATEVYQRRSYPQFDCIGSYLWIWERLVQTESRSEVIARQVHRDRPSSGCER